MKLVALVLVLSTSTLVLTEDRPDYKFPDDFFFGVSTAAFQIEGAWNEDGKGESVWDHGIHANPSVVIDGSNADIACDSYHKYKEDVRMLKELGVNLYRFSISWPRILPNGKTDQINQLGIDYYNNLIDELLANDIVPAVTMLHYDVPQTLQEEGGFTNMQFADYFADYARVLYENFGDRVKYWMTINEPYSVCWHGYGIGQFAPFLKDKEYECIHTLVLAHAKAYRLYDTKFRETQNGSIGIAGDSKWYEPQDPENKYDQLASEWMMQMSYGWFMNPIIYGNYPEIMIKTIANQSILPEFTSEEQEILKGTYDYIGLNHYVTYLVYFNSTNNENLQYSDIVSYIDPTWSPTACSPFLNVVPWGIRKNLVWIKDHYDDPTIIITENGFCGNGSSSLEDYYRADYYKEYMYEVLKAIYEEKVNVIGYSAWSLMDNFEWVAGYCLRYGLYYIDFDDPERTRYRKLSSYVYENIITTRHIDWDYYPDWPPSGSGLTILNKYQIMVPAFVVMILYSIIVLYIIL